MIWRGTHMSRRALMKTYVLNAIYERKNMARGAYAPRAQYYNFICIPKAEIARSDECGAAQVRRAAFIKAVFNYCILMHILQIREVCR